MIMLYRRPVLGTIADIYPTTMQVVQVHNYLKLSKDEILSRISRRHRPSYFLKTLRRRIVSSVFLPSSQTFLKQDCCKAVEGW